MLKQVLTVFIGKMKPFINIIFTGRLQELYWVSSKYRVLTTPIHCKDGLKALILPISIRLLIWPMMAFQLRLALISMLEEMLLVLPFIISAPIIKPSIA